MHIVVMAWLYVTALMALTMASGLAGAAFFASVGLAPVLLNGALAARRIRARRAALVGQQHVHRADDRHAEADG